MVESSLQASAVRYLNRQPFTTARVNGPGPAHVAGDPDVYGCHRGTMFQIELKVGRNKPSKLQVHRMAEWQESQAEVFVCHSMDEVRAAFKQL